MGRPAQMMEGDQQAGMRVEYVKSRQVLRLRGPAAAAGEPVEIPLSELLQRVDLDPSALGLPVRYLLFGGLHGEPSGGTRDVLGVFECQSSARQAFLEVRRQRSNREGWAELAALDGKGRLTTMSWFGMEPAAAKGRTGHRMTEAGSSGRWQRSALPRRRLPFSKTLWLGRR